MANEGLLASSVGSYWPLCSHNGPHWLSIAAGSKDLARLSSPGVGGNTAGVGRAEAGVAASVMGAMKSGTYRDAAWGESNLVILFDWLASAATLCRLLACYVFNSWSRPLAGGCEHFLSENQMPEGFFSASKRSSGVSTMVFTSVP